MEAWSVAAVSDITIIIDGDVFASARYQEWPKSGGRRIDFWHFANSQDITIQGSGMLDGQGFAWWNREILQKNGQGGRPCLITFSQVDGIEISGILVKNSPYYHIVPHDCINGYMHDMEIFVDVFGQMELQKLFSFMAPETESFEAHGFNVTFPTFPLNTDGIDIWGTNFTFRRIKITNFDDAIVPKPSNRGATLSKCTENILIEDCEVVWSVGMTIGSVPPNGNHACVRNVTFRNVVMDKPLKGIYVKSNPGTNGDGEITNITYENFVMYTPIWWGIWIGPQQQHQPGGVNPGCDMFYPIGKCPTNPVITFDGITLKNITSHHNLLPAGVIHCDPVNPCVNMHFEDVQVHTPLWDLLGVGFLTQNAEGVAIRSHPDPGFKPKGYFSQTTERESI
jgi:polygalacturonase